MRRSCERGHSGSRARRPRRAVRMGPEWVAIIALVALFVIGTVLPINMGALAYVAAWLVGMYSLDLSEKEILAGVSGDLILTLIGVTYLFAIARNNGTVDLIVRSAVRGVGGRVALIPWVMFAVTAVLTGIGAVSPAACAIIGPIALGFAGRYGISPLMMGMFVVHGAQAGGFSPISIYGTITNSVMRDNDLPNSEITIFLSSLVINTILAAILFVVLGGRELMSRRIEPEEEEEAAGAGGGTDVAVDTGVRRDQVLTLIAFVGVALVSLVLDKNIGFVAITAAVILSILAPEQNKDTVKQIAWPTVLLVAGVSTYATILTTAGSPEFVGKWAAGLGAVAIGALILCYVGGAAAGDHPDRHPPRGRGWPVGGLLRRGPRGELDHRRREPVLHQRCADAGQQARHDRRDHLLQADPHLRHDRDPRRSVAGVGRPRPPRMVNTDMTESTTGSAAGPLADLLVVDLTRALAGPHATQMLGDLGARVIKVEAPGSGDDTRGWGPPFVGEPDGRQSTYFLCTNRNKESIALDLKDQTDKDVLVGLVERADVLVENFRTGVLERLGLGIEELMRRNPRLVVLSITGFGHDGPEGGRAGYDQIAQGEAGLMSLTGSGPDDPQRVGVPIADLLSGIYGAFGTLAALLQRERTGQGQIVRTSLLAALIGVHAFQGTRATVAGEVPKAQGNHHPSIAPYGLFHCRQGRVQISVGSEKLWRTFAAAFGIDADRPEFASNAERVRNREKVIEEVERA